MSHNYYQQLGVSPQATPDQIKTAYRELANQVHPDKLPPDTSQRVRSLAQQEFLDLQTAYRTLIDPSLRQSYDHERLNAPVLPTQEWSTPPYPDPTLMTHLPLADSDPDPRQALHWQIPLATGLLGFALGLGLATVLNRIRVPEWVPASAAIPIATQLNPDTQSAQSDPSSDPSSEAVSPSDQLPANTSEQAADTDAVESDLSSAAEQVTTAEQVATAATPDPLNREPADPESPDSFTLTATQLNRFVEILIQMQPLLEATTRRMEKATTPAARSEVERQFEVAATKVIESNGLTPTEYQQISIQARQDPELQTLITTVAEQLLEVDDFSPTP